eukprot:SAG31_NODE_19146_length_610_cov_102.780822_1_plen_61_part_10
MTSIEKSIEEMIEDIEDTEEPEPKPKAKRPRSQKQVEALEKARAARAKKIAAKKTVPAATP